MVRKTVSYTLLLLLLAALGFAGSQEMRTYELYSGVNAADSSARTSYRIPVKGASKIYLWIRSQGATADTSFDDSLTTFTALFGDSISFYARDSSGTLVTYGNFPLNTSGYGNRVFPILADSISLSTTGTADTVKWIGINHYATVRPLRTGVTAVLWPAQRVSVNSAGAIIPISTPDPAGVIQSNFMWLRLTPTTRSTSAGVVSTQGLRTTGIHGLRVTATVFFPNK